LEISYQETLDYLFSQLPMFQRTGVMVQKIDLQKTIDLCEHLGNPQKLFKSIHVGGTNGKGSVTHMIASIFQAAGLKVGVFTSPHYKDFRERIKINGQFIEEQYVINFVQKTKTLQESLKPSFFELTSAMAFDYFADQKVDIAIIEVGMGGRLDSTNIILPLISVITNISLDHTEYLGDTLEKIAFEKAGIIKSNTPVVVGEWHSDTYEVFEHKAKECNASITFASKNYSIMTIYDTLEYTHYDVYKKGRCIFFNLGVNLLGNYQQNNLATALQTIDVYNSLDISLKIDNEAIRKGLSNIKAYTTFMGRWQILGKDPLIIADSAHNVGGVELVLEQLKNIRYEQLHVVFGTVKDKDPSAVLDLLPKKAKYYFAKANIPRGLDANELLEKSKEFSLNGNAFNSVIEAFIHAKKNANPKDLVLVFGSIFIVAEVLP